jgi:hypothetical protein
MALAADAAAVVDGNERRAGHREAEEEAVVRLAVERGKREQDATMLCRWPWSFARLAMVATASVACMRANRMVRQREGEWKARNGARRVPWCSPIEQSARSRVREEEARRPWWRLSGAWPPRPPLRGQLLSRWQATTKPGGYAMLGSIHADF